MKCAKVRVRSLTRSIDNSEEETLTFEPGVNLIVGQPNTGKTSWLQLLDYLLGDRNKPADSLGKAITDKYTSARAVLLIDGTECVIERGWGPSDTLTKTYLDGQPHDADEFSDQFLERLRLPVLRYPSGNPYAPRAWKRLGWRSLYRHVYRNEDSWTELVAKQPDGELQACLLAFVGAAEQVFSPESEELVQKRKDLELLVAKKEVYVSTLQELSREILSLEPSIVALTEDVLSTTAQTLTHAFDDAGTKRDQVLEGLRHQASSSLAKSDPAEEQRVADLSKRLALLRSNRDAVNSQVAAIRSRRDELKAHRRAVSDELQRLERAHVAQDLLGPLKVTHCPQCDQRVDRHTPPDVCQLCSQSLSAAHRNPQAASHRIGFEVQQVRAELRELQELVTDLEKQEEELSRVLRDVEDEVGVLNSELQPLHVATASLLPPSVSHLDQERGRLSEKLRQVRRIEECLRQRDKLSKAIDALSAEIATLDIDVSAKVDSVIYSQASDLLSDGMNSYLTALNAGLEARRWTAENVTAKMRQRDTEFYIAGDSWKSRVGGTMKIYFLAAYQYCLLWMTGRAGALYPGFSVVDLPPNPSDMKLLRDQESYLVKPFIDLLASDSHSECQLIMTGHAYDGLTNVNRIDLDHVWGGGSAE